MAKLLKLRRGTTTQHASFTGAEGEVTIDTTKDTAVVHDGSTQAGTPLAKEDMSNVSSASIAGRLGTDSIATTKIAAGALPTDVTVADANISGNLTIESADIVDGTIVNADINASAAIDGTKISPVFGSQTISTSGSVAASDIAVSGTAPVISFTDTNANSDFKVEIDGGVFRVKDITNSNETRVKIHSSGTVDVVGNLDVGAGLDVTGNITVTGTVDGVDVAALNTTVGNLGVSGGAIASSTTATTQSQSDNSTKVATTAYTDTAISNLVDSSPGALNTLNELAAAINDDANFSTTITNNIATKLPLSGGQMTGNITFSGSQTVDGRDVSADGSKLDGIESGATADQSASEIVSLINNQNITPANLEVGSGRIGMDGNDYFTFTNNNRCDLYLSGSNEFRFEMDGDFHADGDIVAFSSTVSSDKKLKENIEVIPNALEKVQALNGVSFTWKRDGTPSAGVIAQEVQAILPEAVKEVTPVKGGDSHLSVNYHALTSILIESIKELKAEIEELKGGK